MDMERIEQMAYDIGYQRGYEKGKADRPRGEWIPCSERLPKTDNTNEINEFNVLLIVRPKKHPEKTPQIYIGKLRPVKGDDGSGNFWGVKTAPCEWTIWGWSYFQEPEVLAWMPLPKPWKGAENSKECHKPQSLYYRAFCEERKDSAYCDGCEFWY